MFVDFGGLFVEGIDYIFELLDDFFEYIGFFFKGSQVNEYDVVVLEFFGYFFEV